MWPLYLAVILIIMNIYVYFLDTNAGRVVTLFLVVYLAGVVVFILIKREQINEQLKIFREISSN